MGEHEYVRRDVGMGGEEVGHAEFLAVAREEDAAVRRLEEEDEAPVVRRAGPRSGPRAGRSRAERPQASPGAIEEDVAVRRRVERAREAIEDLASRRREGGRDGREIGRHLGEDLRQRTRVVGVRVGRRGEVEARDAEGLEGGEHDALRGIGPVAAARVEKGGRAVGRLEDGGLAVPHVEEGDAHVLGRRVGPGRLDGREAEREDDGAGGRDPAVPARGREERAAVDDVPEVGRRGGSELAEAGRGGEVEEPPQQREDRGERREAERAHEGDGIKREQRGAEDHGEGREGHRHEADRDRGPRHLAEVVDRDGSAREPRGRADGERRPEGGARARGDAGEGGTLRDHPAQERAREQDEAQRGREGEPEPGVVDRGRLEGEVPGGDGREQRAGGGLPSEEPPAEEEDRARRRAHDGRGRARERHVEEDEGRDDAGRPARRAPEAAQEDREARGEERDVRAGDREDVRRARLAEARPVGVGERAPVAEEERAQEARVVGGERRRERPRRRVAGARERRERAVGREAHGHAPRVGHRHAGVDSPALPRGAGVVGARVRGRRQGFHGARDVHEVAGVDVGRGERGVGGHEDADAGVSARHAVRGSPGLRVEDEAGPVRRGRLRGDDAAGEEEAGLERPEAPREVVALRGRAGAGESRGAEARAETERAGAAGDARGGGGAARDQDRDRRDREDEEGGPRARRGGGEAEEDAERRAEEGGGERHGRTSRGRARGLRNSARAGGAGAERAASAEFRDRGRDPGEFSCDRQGMGAHPGGAARPATRR